MNKSENFLLVMLPMILYFTCVYIEVKAMNKNKIDIFYKENILLVIMNSFTFLLAVGVFCYGVHNFIYSILINEEIVEFYGMFLAYILSSLAYIVGYIRKRIYAFISPKNRLRFWKYSMIYREEK